MAFEFVAIVGLLFLLGKWIAGPVGAGIAVVIGWIGSTLRLYFRFAPQSPVAKAKEAAHAGKTSVADDPSRAEVTG